MIQLLIRRSLNFARSHGLLCPSSCCVTDLDNHHHHQYCFTGTSCSFASTSCHAIVSPDPVTSALLLAHDEMSSMIGQAAVPSTLEFSYSDECSGLVHLSQEGSWTHPELFAFPIHGTAVPSFSFLLMVPLPSTDSVALLLSKLTQLESRSRMI